MNCGRKVGEIQNPRDERGWMIPRQGTIRRNVYDLMAEGLSQDEICARLNMTKTLFYVNKHYIVYADRVNARELKHNRWQREREAFWAQQAAKISP